MATGANREAADASAAGRGALASATLHRKAQAALTGALMGEEPRVVLPGLGSSALVATDTRLFVFKTGARAGLPFGARLKEFEFESVMRIDLRPAGEVEVLVVHAPLKIAYCSSYWADRRDDPWKARNAIPLEPGDPGAERALLELTRLLEEFRGRAGVPHAEPATEETQAEQEGARACSKCGNRLDAGWHFCPRCGSSTTRPVARSRSNGRRRRRPDTAPDQDRA